MCSLFYWARERLVVWPEDITGIAVFKKQMQYCYRNTNDCVMVGRNNRPMLYIKRSKLDEILIRRFCVSL